MQEAPVRSIAECNKILNKPGSIHETELAVINGRVLRVYKNIWSSIREYWIWIAQQHKDKPYLVFEDRRYTYNQAFDVSLQAAYIFRSRFGVRKGDRVAIVARNCPEWLIAFLGLQMIGGVAVCVNAWLSHEPLNFSVRSTTPKLIIVDSERISLLDSESLKSIGNTPLVVLDAPPNFSHPKCETWETIIRQNAGQTSGILDTDPGIGNEDNATILFTSGTTGLPKGVLSTQRQFLTAIPNGLASRSRFLLRNYETPPPPNPNEKQKAIIVPVPLFHASGLNCFSMLGTYLGYKIVLMRRWEPKEGARLLVQESVTHCGGVPLIVSDLIESPAAGKPTTLETLLFGGAPSHSSLPNAALKAFPGAILNQVYGITETNGYVATFSGPDYVMRPTSTGILTPVTDIAIVDNNKIMPTGGIGEIWLRGSNVMKEYWNDPEATKKAITPDGWYKTGDIGFVDDEGFVYIKDRSKDIIIRGGENVDCTAVENAIHLDSRIAEAAAVGVPDPRYGELVSVVVKVKDRWRGKVLEKELIEMAKKNLPQFAVPVMVVIQDEPLARNAVGKIFKPPARKRAAEEWEKRKLTAKSSPKL